MASIWVLMQRLPLMLHLDAREIRVFLPLLALGSCLLILISSMTYLYIEKPGINAGKKPCTGYVKTGKLKKTFGNIRSIWLNDRTGWRAQARNLRHHHCRAVETNPGLIFFQR
jgi:peptidoglycan/LPS O-acetylase OafA/YrhL